MLPAAVIRDYRARPVEMVRRLFGVEPDGWQVKVLEDFPATQRLAMRACKGPGKSAVLSWCIWNFMLTRPHPKVVATSISGDNLRDGLWAELAKWLARSPVLQEAFTWTTTRLMMKTAPETWFASARQWSRSADPQQQADTLAGVHADHVLFVIDEAGGVPDAVSAAAEGALSSGKETKLLISGNPTELAGPLWRACTQERHLWRLHEITGDPDDPGRAPRVDAKWAREQIEKYGRDSNYVLVNVFGQFPRAQSNSLLGVEDVTAAMRREYPEQAYRMEPRILGVDVARQGMDRTVFFPRQGRVAFRPRVYRDADLMRVSGNLAKYVEAWKPHAVFVDGTGGYGSGVVDRMRQLGFHVREVIFGSEAIDPKFMNRRAEMWWKMAQWVRAGGALPNEQDMVRELSAPTYDHNAKDKLYLETKDDIRKRLGASPDLGDALALTFADVVIAADDEPYQALKPNNAWDYDPFAVRA